MDGAILKMSKNSVKNFKDYPIVAAFLHGSQVHGTADEHSDIDIEIVINAPNMKYMPKNDEKINHLIMSKKELEEDLKENRHGGRFYKRLFYPVVPLKNPRKVKEWRRLAIRQFILTAFRTSGSSLRTPDDVFKQIVRYDVEFFPALVKTWARMFLLKPSVIKKLKKDVRRELRYLQDRKLVKLPSEEKSLFAARLERNIGIMRYYGGKIEALGKDTTLKELRDRMEKINKLTPEEEHFMIKYLHV